MCHLRYRPESVLSAKAYDLRPRVDAVQSRLIGSRGLVRKRIPPCTLLRAELYLLKAQDRVSKAGARVSRSISPDPDFRI